MHQSPPFEMRPPLQAQHSVPRRFTQLRRGHAAASPLRVVRHATCLRVRGVAVRTHAEDRARHRAWPLPHPITIVARFDDPLAVFGPACAHSDMMWPNNDSSDLSRSRSAVLTPVPSKIELGSASQLRPHPPSAPLGRSGADAACARIPVRRSTRMTTMRGARLYAVHVPVCRWGAPL